MDHDARTGVELFTGEANTAVEIQRREQGRP
jgi:hypothetical protein